MECTCRWLRDSAAFATTSASRASRALPFLALFQGFGMRRLTSALIVTGIFAACPGIVPNADVSAASGGWASTATRAQAWLAPGMSIDRLGHPAIVRHLITNDLRAA